MSTSLSEHEIERYSRQLILPGWSAAKQSRLKNMVVHLPASVPLLGIYLAGAGVGSLIVNGTMDNFYRLLLTTINPACHISFDDIGAEPDEIRVISEKSTSCFSLVRWQSEVFGKEESIPSLAEPFSLPLTALALASKILFAA